MFFRNLKHGIITLGILLGVVSGGAEVFASIGFSVVPVNGGNSVRFTRGDLNSGLTKEVRIRITAPENQQYQVFQQLISPFVNERGVTLDRPVLLAGIQQGSVGSGTAYLTNFEPVFLGEQLLYTSSPMGMSESFTIVYNVDPQHLKDSGTFNGLLQFSLRQVGGGPRQTATITFFIDSTAELKVDVAGSRVRNAVRVDSRDDRHPEHVEISFKGNAGNRLKVFLETLINPINDLNNQVPSGILKVITEGAENGELSYPNAFDLPRNRVQIYQSTQQFDSFSAGIRVSPDRLAELVAGSYRGVLRFVVETERDSQNFDIDLEVNIPPVFEIVLDFPQGPVSFSKIIPGGAPEIKTVNVEVKTNLRRPYKVKQRVGDLMTNERGKPIPKKYFTLRQDLDPGSSGRVTHDQFQPVEQGETTIFYSDAVGSAAKFTTFYRLEPYPGMESGDYRTAIMFDLGEL